MIVDPEVIEVIVAVEATEEAAGDQVDIIMIVIEI